MSFHNSPDARAKLAAQYHAQVRPSNLTPSVTYGNATTSGVYTGNRMGSPRAEADQHFNYSSAPMVAQIARVGA